MEVTVIELLTRTVCEYCQQDKTAPSVVVSWIGDRWYVAIHRFTGRYAEGRHIVAKTTGLVLDDVLKEADRLFLAAAGRGPAMRDLEEML